MTDRLDTKFGKLSSRTENFKPIRNVIQISEKLNVIK